MKGLLKFEKKLARVEGAILAASLIAMLSLAVYGIAYRNAVVPLITWLQTEDKAPPAGEDEKPTATPTPTPAPAAAPSADDAAESDDDAESDFDDDAESDFEDAAPAAPPKPAAKDDDDAESDFDDDAESDFDTGDDEKPAAEDDDDAESDFDSDFGDDDGDAKPAAGAVKPPPPPATPSAAAEKPPVLKEDSALVRFLLWFNFDWLDIVLRHLILWVAFLGGALATQRRKHIAIDALARQMPRKWRPPIAFVVSIVSLVVCVALAYAAFQFTALEASHGRPLFGAVPGWVGPVIIPVGFGLIAVHYCFRVLEAGLALAGRHELPPDALEVTLQ